MKEQLLIVDDEEDIRESLSTYFRSLGYSVIAASDGNSALKQMTNRRTDVVISDIVMPLMDGVELLRRIRCEFPMTRVIMITGYVTLEHVLACMRHGADDCVFKPLADLGELTASVTSSCRCLDRWQGKMKELVGMKPRSPDAV